MSNLSFGVQVTGLESIDEDFRKIYADIGRKAYEASKDVQLDMRDLLKEHIRNDVYAKWNPKKYERRSKNPSLGRPLTDDTYITTQAPWGNAGPSGINITAPLEYDPQGEHVNQNWHTADENELIRRIEQKNPPYFYKAQQQVPRRPFWQRFIAELVDSGRLEEYFINSMLRQSPDEPVAYTGVEADFEHDGDY